MRTSRPERAGPAVDRIREDRLEPEPAVHVEAEIRRLERPDPVADVPRAMERLEGHDRADPTAASLRDRVDRIDPCCAPREGEPRRRDGPAVEPAEVVKRGRLVG